MTTSVLYVTFKVLFPQLFNPNSLQNIRYLEPAIQNFILKPEFIR
jgi:hypothetical protein